MTKKSRVDLYLPRPLVSPSPFIKPTEPDAFRKLPRYTVEQRDSCTIVWLGRGEGRTMIAAFRDR